MAVPPESPTPMVLPISSEGTAGSQHPLGCNRRVGPHIVSHKGAEGELLSSKDYIPTFQTLG